MEYKNYIEDDSYTWNSDSGDEYDYEYHSRPSKNEPKKKPLIDSDTDSDSDSEDEIINKILKQEQMRRIAIRKKNKK